MSARHRERILARRSTVQVLYTSEIQNEPPTVLLESGRCLSEDGPLSDYALTLIKGVEAHQAAIDCCLGSTSENWTIARMPIVDRTILRLATYEMLYMDDVPISVAINEAVELAKDFGGEDESPRFVNGVLGRIAKRIEAEGADALRALAFASADARTKAASADAGVEASSSAEVRAGSASADAELEAGIETDGEASAEARIEAGAASAEASAAASAEHVDAAPSAESGIGAGAGVAEPQAGTDAASADAGAPAGVSAVEAEA